MNIRKTFNMIVSLIMLTSLFLGSNVNVMAAPTSPTDESKVPHYYGPWPNWANSPLTMPDAQVVITGKGSGAEAVATVGANGSITAITITNPGSGYSNPKIDIIGPGSGVKVKAEVAKTASVVAINVTAFGSGYTAPVVTISGGSGSGATATAYGRVDAVTVTDGGSGYTFPTVDFDLPAGPGGVQAQGHAVCVGDLVDGPYCQGTNLTIDSIVVDSGGSGYSTAPGVAILNGTRFDPAALNPGGQYATATSSLSITAIGLDTFGDGYKSAPTVSITDPTGSGATATAEINTGAITAITVTDGGSGYITSGIRKFVDGLPMLTEAGANNLGQYMPIAVPDTTTFPGTDYYVIALVQYREQMHSDLPPTLLREYVQLETSVVQGKHVALQTDLVDPNAPTVDVLMPDGSQAYGVDDPHFLGPVIVAQKDRAVRITFYNLLPTGSGGDLFMPVDSSFMGSGMTPDTAEPFDPTPVLNGTVMDLVRNPVCNEAPKSADCFKDNRATLHLHGGITPWISDGTPHQWITPADENTPWPQGVSVGNVPDMIGQAALDVGVPDCSAPGDGCSTFYYTNQQSARLMFYHDHAWGITRLNVYAGEAAGYLIQDPTEKALVDGGVIPADQIPLVIQDRTFVPSDEQLYDQYDADGNLISYGQDPTWDKARWGGEGSLWYEHVYMPAQNPSDPTGMSAYGRWMYGPWFWPPQNNVKYGPIDNPYFDPNCNLDDPATWQYDTDPFCEPPLIPGTPNNSAGMEQFNDTPIVNGTAYPTVTLEPKAYRFRILNAANDRFFNFQWYVADPTTASTGLNANGEVIGGTEVAFNSAELAAAQLDPNIFPTPDTSLSPAGPDWVQIGTEGGFLPAPVVVPNQPTTWIIDPTRFDVGNVDLHSLLIAPAERADVVVDFSQYAGQTLILYNDAPAAFPARVASYDYYTGAPDLSPVGAPTILPGYGPNTRTIMQVKIAANPPADTFNLAALKAAFRHHADGSGVFESGQHPIIVGQAAYNSAYGTSFAGAAWCNAPSRPSAKCDGFARISEQGGDLFKFDTLLGNKISIPLEPKAIHDEMNAATFDEFGRMTANLGIEAVPSNPGGQNINLMPYVFPPTEVIDATSLPKNDGTVDPGTGDLTITPITGIAMADGTQIWKITHNGVDTHPIHWHLYDLQLLNRVTWDNIIIPPDASELGWKDTIRISPLEDTIVALRPIIPWLPFEVPNSVRELSPMMPDGALIASATLADALGLGIPPSNGAGEPIDVFNHLINFGWEYVFHCHILSHEEMDMMHPVLVALPPKAPSGLVFDAGTLTWNDNSITETAFIVEKLVNGVWTQVYQLDRPLNDPNTTGAVGPTAAIFTEGDYRVFAQNTVGDTWDYADPAINEIVSGGFPTVSAKSEPAYWYFTNGGPAAPSDLTATNIAPYSLTLNWLDNSSNEDGFNIQVATDSGFTTNVQDFAVGTDVTSLDIITLAPATMYYFQVNAFNGTGTSAWSAPLVETTLPLPSVPAAPTSLAATNITQISMTLNWTNNELVAPVDGFTVQIATDSGFTTNLQEFTVGAGVTSLDVTGLTANTMYYFRMDAFNVAGHSAWSTENLFATTLPLPTAPSGLSATNVLQSSLTLNWVDNSDNEDGFNVQMASVSDFSTVLNTFTVGAGVTTLDVTGLTANTTYYFRVEAFNLGGSSGWSAPLSVTTLPTPLSPPAAPSNLNVTNYTLSSLRLAWTDNSNNEDGFTIQIATDKNFSQSLQTFNVGPNVTDYLLYPLAPNTKYFMRVSAFNVAGSSPWSPTLVAKTLK